MIKQVRGYRVEVIGCIAALFFLFCTSVPAHAADPAIKSKSLINFDLQIPLPVPQPRHEINTTNVLAGYGIAYYIESLYKFLVGIAGILAVLAIVYGGFLWMTSAGNTGRIGEAQKVIGNALAGLALALGSFMLLQTNNPKMVEFGRITGTGIDTQKVDGSAGLPAPSHDPTSDPTGACCYMAIDGGSENKAAKLETQTGCQTFVSQLINDGKAKLDPIYFCVTPNISRETPVDVCWKVPSGFPETALQFCDEKRVIQPRLGGGASPHPSEPRPGICCLNTQGRRSIVGSFLEYSFEACQWRKDESTTVHAWFCEGAHSSDPLGKDVCGQRSSDPADADEAERQWQTPHTCPAGISPAIFK